ncbi:hypothetical protein FD961_01645 [Polynucleobacter sp. TSB-Sco08W16]|uniref:hypothetical protein n=1 Tax=Polynucleobacter sp. TSB-Sco08W16 TaxID=1758374 RepID=UPI001BFE23F3|nr:hypothetical protein [Polynucleobacter sp. TSB-Sco08W16]QWD74559.1 hypothetical protein FD961_01645 [Polynucleobacter sp. TSB-Sco08W16]
MLKDHIKIFFLAIILLLARYQSDYEIIGLTALIAFLALFFASGKTEEKLFYFLFFQFFEYFELIDGIPVSIPYLIICIFILFYFIKDGKQIDIFIILLIFISIYSYIISSIYPAKLFLTYFMIYVACNGLNFLKLDCDSKNNIIFKKIELFYIFLITFWILEAIIHFVLPNFKTNIVVGNDYRPIGFFSEPTYFIFLIATTAIILSRVHKINILIALSLSIYSQSRIFTPILYFAAVKKNIILFFFSLTLIIVCFLFFIGDDSYFARFIDITDSIRGGLLKNALSSLSIESVLFPPNDNELHKTGIFYFQLVNVFGGLTASIMFLYLTIHLISKAGYVGSMLILISFFHPIQYSAISLTALLLGYHLKNVYSQK